ncbi:MAG: hypothetical protein OEZ58_00510 [Gammaproteobacteria bacterium]|nr:hypothetical protein [Gammaproteobacteria bacterium]MDH5727455.1 hypothetical protein [Gammaproteobacteria bacterium]
MKNLVNSILFISLTALSASAFACGGEASGKHMGNITNINTAKSTFTILDAETQSPITFKATSDVMSGLKNNSRVMVNYEEDEQGALNAIGVMF